MSVNREQVLQVAKLAKLQLGEDEIAQLTEELNRILAHVGELSAAETASVEGLSGAAEWPAPLRDDVAGADPLLQSSSTLSAHFANGFFTVPRLAALDASPE
jgi:aspartyl-tRNA(Asn)/glutamyl-tRNA(Gln) amidotransferase subunit C